MLLEGIVDAAPRGTTAVTALGTAASGLATSAWDVLLARMGTSGNVNGPVAARCVQSAFDSGSGAADFRARFSHNS
jgi:hypothetical protein